MAALVARLTSATNVTVAVFGDSAPHGTDCAHPEWPLNFPAVDADVRCAWPGRFADYLRAALPHSHVSLVDLTISGAPMGVTLSRLSEFSHSLRGATAGVAFVDHTANDEVSTNAAQTTAVYEAFIAEWRELHFALDVVFVAACVACPRVSAAIAAVANAHDVPFISYAAFIDTCRLFTPDGGDFSVTRLSPGAPLLRSNPMHPPWHVHALIGEVVGSCFAAAWAAACDGRAAHSAALEETVLADKGEVLRLTPSAQCPTMRASYEADVAAGLRCTSATPNAAAATACDAASALPSSSNAWPLVEDRPGKWGWVSTSVAASITVNVSFSSSPRLIITYLKSYEGLGSAVFSMRRVADGIMLPGHFTLDGLYTGSKAAARHSQLEVFSVDAAHVWAGIVSEEELQLVGTIVDDGSGIFKFKIAGINAC